MFPFGGPLLRRARKNYSVPAQWSAASFGGGPGTATIDVAAGAAVLVGGGSPSTAGGVQVGPYPLAAGTYRLTFTRDHPELEIFTAATGYNDGVAQSGAGFVSRTRTLDASTQFLIINRNTTAVTIGGVVVEKLA